MTERNIKLTIEYDGTDFLGWQLQPEARTVQGTVEAALQGILKHPVRLHVAGRTDTGVHAYGQVANFVTDRSLPIEGLRKGLNSVLPRDVVVHAAQEVAADFHSRYSAQWRIYRYVIGKTLSAIGRQYCWYFPLPLNLARMQSAAEFLLGEQDLKSFCQAKADVPHYLSRVVSASWTENDKAIFFEIKANRFLHNMVRIVVGTLVDVGLGKLAPAVIKEMILARDRTRAGRTAPAQGLFLMRVEY